MVTRRVPGRNSAFTLIELLVVVGIISVLISILLPAIGLVRQQVMTTKCLSNLRQIGMAISTYANDHNYCLVPGDYYGLADGFSQKGGGSWADTLADEAYLNVPIGHIHFPGDTLATFDPLYDRENILVCPSGIDDNVLSYHYPTSQTDGTGMMYFARAADTTLEAVRSWYAVNMSPEQERQGLRPLPFNLLPDYNGTTPDWRINRITDFPNDTQLPLVFDGVWMFFDDPNRINARHGNNTQTNILFADFHCETQLTSTLPNDHWYVR